MRNNYLDHQRRLKMPDTKTRRPRELYELILSNPKTSRRMFHITPEEEELMNQYARAKVRIAHYAQYRRARLLYQYILKHYPDVVEQESVVSLAQKCILISQSFLFLGVLFVIFLHDVLPIKETLVGVFGIAALLFSYGFFKSIIEKEDSEVAMRKIAYAEASAFIDSKDHSWRYGMVLREWKKYSSGGGTEGRRYWCRFEESTPWV